MAVLLPAQRGHAGHRAAQDRGKADIFADFRIRVAQVRRLADRTG